MSQNGHDMIAQKIQSNHVSICIGSVNISFMKNGIQSILNSVFDLCRLCGSLLQAIACNQKGYNMSAISAVAVCIIIVAVVLIITFIIFYSMFSTAPPNQLQDHILT